MPYCHTCHQGFASHGIATHRAAHRRRREDCTITLSTGTWTYSFSAHKEGACWCGADHRVAPAPQPEEAS